MYVQRYTVNMQLFGRKAKEQPDASGVPPELQPYYILASRWVRIRQAVVRVLPVVTLIIIIAAIVVAATLWWRHGHPIKVAHQMATNQSGPSTPSHQSSPAASNSSQGRSSQQTAPSSSVGQQNALPAPSQKQTVPIPNTGPGAGIFLIAAGVGVASTAVQYRRQIRRLRSPQR